MKNETVVIVDSDFRSLIKAQKYEKYVLAIIKRSTVFFKGCSFEQMSSQAHGECDFVDNKKRKYDAKLIFDEHQGQLIGDPKNDFIKWLQEMTNEKSEYSECIRKRNNSFLANTRFYEILKARIETVKDDETAILFIPFPIVDDSPESLILQQTTDFLQAVYDKLVEDGAVNCMAVYFIYPSMEPNVYVLRNETRKREYIRCDELGEFITYSSWIAQ